MNRCFVTGGTGAVGRHFVPQLVSAGWHTTVLTRDPAKVRLPTSDRLALVRGDLDSSETRAQLETQREQYDVVFHLAASLDYFGKREALFATNVGATAFIAAFAQRCGARRFVHASSIEAMGTHTLAEIPATLDRMAPPASTYGESKLAAEQAALALNAQGVSSCSLRIGNVYGPVSFNFVVESAAALLARARFFEWHAAYGGRYISPVHNADVSAGLLAAARSTHAGPLLLVGPAATFAEIFQLCADTMGVPYAEPPMSWFDRLWLARRMARVRREQGPFDSVAYALAPPAPRVHRAFSMEESCRALHWRPEVALRAGIRETLQWARAEGHLKF